MSTLVPDATKGKKQHIYAIVSH